MYLFAYLFISFYFSCYACYKMNNDAETKQQSAEHIV